MANDWSDPIGRQLLLRSPVIFVYRNPLDIVVSERDWFVRPDHAFSGYLNSFSDGAEQLRHLIADESVMGTLRDRIIRYAGWINFQNVVAVSYEELVGSRGGGSDAEQVNAVWALQLKLHVPGSPDEYCGALYDPASPTFSHGRIGRHAECFEAQHFSLVNSLRQDFMEILGYSERSRTSSRVSALRRRPLLVKELQPEALYRPRLVREDVMGWNVIEVAGKYFPVRQGENLPSLIDAETTDAPAGGFVTIRDAVDSIIHRSAREHEEGAYADTPRELEIRSGYRIVRFRNRCFALPIEYKAAQVASLTEDDTRYTLSAEPVAVLRRLIDFPPDPQLVASLGEYNIVAYRGLVYGIPQSLGEMDLRTTDIRGRKGVVVDIALTRVLDRVPRPQDMAHS